MTKFAKRSAAVLLLFLSFHLLVSREAHAYLDPATGSYITQIVIAAVIGGLFVIKQYFHRIKLFFNKLFAKEDSLDEDEP